MNNCGQIFRKSALLCPDLPALYCGSDSFSYAYVFERACRLVNGLQDLGLVAQQRVATLGPNSKRSLEEIGGLALGGFIRVPLHQGNSLENHLHMLKDSEVTALICDAESLDELAPHLAAVPSLKLVLSAGSVEQDELKDIQRMSFDYRDYESLLEASSPEDGEWAIEPEDIIHIGYTGGTTGRAKGTVQTHAGWLRVTTENIGVLPPMDHEDPYLAATALSGAGGSYIFPALARFMPIVIVPKFVVADVLEQIRKFKPSFSVMLPGMLREILDHPAADETDFSCLKVLFVVGTPMSARSITEATSKIGDVLLFGYGQSESLPATILTATDVRRGIDVDPNLLLSVGRPVTLARVRVVGPGDVPVVRGQIGEVQIDTAGNMREYWRNAKETAARMTSDGYVRTGDLGCLDSKGYLYLSGRREDLIVSGNRTFFPTAVENAISAHPAVREVAVVGGPDRTGSEEPVAVIFLDVDQSGGDISAWCAEHLDEDLSPARLVFRSEPLPKSPSGKILRRVVKEQEWEHFTRDGRRPGHANDKV